jgi:DNA-binding XRE family transcriptional regulator
MQKTTNELRILREHLRMKQHELAALVGCSERAIAHVEAGHTRGRVARDVARVLHEMLDAQ